MDTVLIISSWPTGLYDYVQYMQMQSICIVIAYADGKYMRMPHLCRCPAYGYVEPMLYSLFSRSDPKKGNAGFGREDDSAVIKIFNGITLP
ncbi:hypothetical protein FD824_27470, partial [Klebsiella pneumoniae]|nr:hypothetical protein [Klebsiella pneumoniae]